MKGEFAPQLNIQLLGMTSQSTWGERGYNELPDNFNGIFF